MKYIKVDGISSINTNSSYNYVYPFFVENDYEAISKVLEYANDEYNVLRDAAGKVISEYKEFESIKNIQIFED